MKFERKEILSILAKSPAQEVILAFQEAGVNVDYKILRPAETGTVMARGRMGATGNAFNFGEIVVTRASIELATGEIGHGFAQGRSKEHAKIAALCDALSQAPSMTEVVNNMVAKLNDNLQKRREIRAAEAAKTKVDFFTMVRGEDE